MSNFYQLSLFDVNEETRKFLTDCTSDFFELLRSFVSFFEVIPSQFYNAYYKTMGRSRTYSLESMLMFFIYKNFRSIAKDKTLLNILKDSPDLRLRLGFSQVPNPSQISRFRIEFSHEIHLTLDNLVSIVNKELEGIDSDFNDFLITDTTGFEGYVTENNPKYYETMIRNAKAFAKTDKAPEGFDPVLYAQSKMPKKASANNDLSLTYLNGHFGYYLPAMIITNGVGVIQDIQFPDDTQKFIENKLPADIKDEYDSTALIPSLEIFFAKQSVNQYDYLLADSGFDGYDNYKYISKKDLIPIIPLNKRNGKTNANSYRYSKDNPDANFYFESNGNLICRQVEKPMKNLGPILSKKRADRFSYGCPLIKTHMVNGKNIYAIDCENPCTDALHGRKVNIAFDEEYRFNIELPRNTEKWQNFYKKRTVCERAIGQLKDYLNINGSHIRNTTSLKSAILLAGITQLIGTLIMLRSRHLNHLRAFKSAA